MKAVSPIDGKTYYFVDKCLPFGASISCSHFQRFSNAVAHLVRWTMKKRHSLDKPLVNYLNNYLFIAMLRAICNNQMRVFLDICQSINFPVALEKTVWGMTQLIFLGLLIDTVNQLILLPEEKINRGKELLSQMLTKKNRKTTVCELQRLTGFLNFLGRAIVPGRAFTHRMYAYTKSDKLKLHHHVRFMGELRSNMVMWFSFLSEPTIFSHPFIDFETTLTPEQTKMFSDASGNFSLGFGAICSSSWMFGQWDNEFMKARNPTIEYLELFGVLAGVLTWLHRFHNKRIILFCDNSTVVEMINSTSSSCKQCMILIRQLVLESLKQNTRVFARHLSGKSNYFSDSLSRMDFDRFWRLSDTNNWHFESTPTEPLASIWPVSKVWNDKLQ